MCDPTPSAGAVHVVDLRSGTVRATLTGVGSPQTAVVAHDGKLAYVSELDRTVRRVQSPTPAPPPPPVTEW